MSGRILNREVAEVFEPLLHPSRYKGAKGGRGSGKSHFFAEQLVEDSLAERGLLSVCVREIQKSLKDSAKRLIQSKLDKFRLGTADGFKVYSSVIETPGDGAIIFQGMQDHTSESIKSLEGFKRCWVEEAQTLSATSLMLLRPTIRADESELWFSWNPRRKTDPTDQMFRGSRPPTGSVLVTANWSDNPWFPKALEQERLDCLNANPDQYDHIWEGGYATAVDGAYYAKQLAEAREEGRIGNVGRDPLMPIRAIWDIGGTGAKADAVGIWIKQTVGREIRWLEYYEAQGQPLAYHLHWLRENWPDAYCILPHDGKTNDRVHDVSFESAIRAAGFDVKVVPNQGAGADRMRIEAGRRLFPVSWFDATRCELGLDWLGQYHEKKHDLGHGLGPLHDDSSHCADAFGLGCVEHEFVSVKRKVRRPNYSQGAWMG